LTIGVVLIILLELTGRQRDGSRLPSRRERANRERTDDEPAADPRG
jgi:hypothetical protein